MCATMTTIVATAVTSRTTARTPHAVPPLNSSVTTSAAYPSRSSAISATTVWTAATKSPTCAPRRKTPRCVRLASTRVAIKTASTPISCATVKTIVATTATSTAAAWTSAPRLFLISTLFFAYLIFNEQKTTKWTNSIINIKFKMFANMSRHAHELQVRVSPRLQDGARQRHHVHWHRRVQGEAVRVQSTVRESCGLVQLQVRPRLSKVPSWRWWWLLLQGGGRQSRSQALLHEQLLSKERVSASEHVWVAARGFWRRSRPRLRLQCELCVRAGRS